MSDDTVKEVKGLPQIIDAILNKKEESPKKSQVSKLIKEFEKYVESFKDVKANKPKDLTQTRKAIECLKQAEEAYTVKESDIYTSYEAKAASKSAWKWISENSGDKHGIDKVIEFKNNVDAALKKQEQASKRASSKGAGGAASNYKKDRDDSLIDLVVGHLKSTLYGKEGEPNPLTKKKVKDELEKVAKGAKAIGGKAISGLSNAWAYGGNNEKCKKLYDHGNKAFHPDKPKE